MWPRVVEMMTAVSLALSPFMFRAQSDPVIVWPGSRIALAIALLAGASYWPWARQAHLSMLLVAVGLIVWERFVQSPPPPIHQNHIVVGLFLLIVALLPNDASQPTGQWRDDPAGRWSVVLG